MNCRRCAVLAFNSFLVCDLIAEVVVVAMTGQSLYLHTIFSSRGITPSLADWRNALDRL
jgi:hypothetical protein